MKRADGYDHGEGGLGPPFSWAAALFLAGLVAAGPAGAASMADGLEAYDAGDYRAAVRIWRELARAGDAEAQVALAVLYRTGTGLALDPAAARRLYRAAAEQGNADGQLNLGEMLARGEGGPRDSVEAHKWLSLAADQGRGWAVERARALALTMTAAEIAEAERRARVFRRELRRRR